VALAAESQTRSASGLDSRGMSADVNRGGKAAGSRNSKPATPEKPSRDVVDSITDAWRPEMPDLVSSELELTRRAARLFARLEREFATRLASWGLTAAEFNVLIGLRSAGPPYRLRPVDLRDRLLLSSGGISNILNRLEKAGLVERERDERDGRSSLVRLTERGVETADGSMRTWAESQPDIYRTVAPEVTRAAADALREVMVALGDHELPSVGGAGDSRPKPRRRKAR
jgi:DNA-binding MarR family transcriptional regulator